MHLGGKIDNFHEKRVGSEGHILKVIFKSASEKLV